MVDLAAVLLVASVLLVVPVQRSGQLMGALELYLNAWRELTEDQTDLLVGVASQAAVAIRHAQLFQAQEENALTDELTKLPNRRALAQQFLKEMQRARRHRKSIAFLWRRARCISLRNSWASARRLGSLVSSSVRAFS